jgi:hypothetical protein
VTALANQIDDSPMSFALLQVIDRQLSDLVSAETTCHKNCE